MTIRVKPGVIVRTQVSLTEDLEPNPIPEIVIYKFVILTTSFSLNIGNMTMNNSNGNADHFITDFRNGKYCSVMFVCLWHYKSQVQ